MLLCVTCVAEVICQNIGLVDLNIIKLSGITSLNVKFGVIAQYSYYHVFSEFSEVDYTKHCPSHIDNLRTPFCQF